MKITSSYSFLYLSAFLAIYIQYFSGKTYESSYVFWGILIYTVFFLLASITKKNEVTIFSVGITMMIFSIFLDKYPKGSTEYLYIVFVLVLFSLIFLVDFLFLRKDLAKGSLFKKIL